MSGLYAVIIGLFVIIGTPLLFFIAAQKSKKGYKRGKRKFYSLSKNYFHLKDQIETEADRWPIYARPLLFTEIDHNAQIEFAKAQQALFDADQILPKIETIDEPKIDEQFILKDLFNVIQNLNIILLRSELVEHVNALEAKIVNINSSIRSLRVNRHQVEKRRLEVEKSIQELKIRTAKIHKRLKPLDIWKSFEAHNFTWIVTSADRCELEASNSIGFLSDQGYIEHATADIFVRIGDFSLDCIELFLESQEISRRYKLDQFFQLFNKSTSFLQSVLEMDDVWSGWKKLKEVKPYIDQLPQTRQEAERSLRNFKNRQKRLVWLIGSISQIDIGTEIEVAEVLEKECTNYWYSYAERKTYWEKALGFPPKFPLTELNHFQSLLVTEIVPQIDVDTPILQSQILDLIKTIGDALELHASIENLISQLKKELDDHKEAQEIVNELLDSQGEATYLFEGVKDVIVDTSPDISDWGTRLVYEYKEYSARAERVKGADFPELLKSLEQFIVYAEKLLKAHNSQMVQLKADYQSFYEHIYLINNELSLYKEYVPKFEVQSVKMFDIASHESHDFLNLQRIDTYSWLRPATNDMRAWIEKNDFFIEQARNKYHSFEAGKRQVEKRLDQTQEEIGNQRDRVEQKGKWYKSEILPRIDAIERSFYQEKRIWERILERNWVEYNITRAILECKKLTESFETKLIELTQIVEKANQKEHQLNSKVEVISSQLRRIGTKLSPETRHYINSLMKMAGEASNFDLANRLIGYAFTLAMRRATPQVQREVKQIVNNYYSDGGPIFAGPVDNRRGKIGGRSR